MENTKSNNGFLILVASVALIADLITIAQAIFSQSYLTFWTFNWFIALVFIFLLLLIGIYLFYIGSQNDVFDTILIIFGGLYIFLSIALYIKFGYAQLHEQNSVSQFFGYLTLLFFLSFIGLSAIFVQDNKTVLYSSYGYAVAGLAYILMLVGKYVFLGKEFSFLTFSGEIVLILFGAWLFIKPYSIAIGKSKRANFIMKYYLIDNREEVDKNNR